MGGWLFYWENFMVEHVSIADSDRHEPKHASTAVSGQVLKSVGGGLTAFSLPTYAELTDKPNAQGYLTILTGQSVAASQQPSAVGTPLIVEFGVAQTTTNVSLSALGNITFNVAGQYELTFFLRFGRTTAAGDAYLFNRVLLNGAQVLNSNALRLSTQDIITPFSTTLKINANVGDVFRMEIMRDSAGINNGGLFQVIPTLGGWSPAPSATVSISKFAGLV
jgi:hypothetical protein